MILVDNTTVSKFLPLLQCCYFLSLPQFLTKLTELFADKKGKGTVWLTHKRCEPNFALNVLTEILPDSYDGEDAVMSSNEVGGDDKEYPCLVRATDGKNVQFSTLVSVYSSDPRRQTQMTMYCKVQPGDLDKFHTTYGTLLKTSMTTLRKRDKKREKQRAEEQAARKRKAAETVVVRGPKRGNGRRKRQRLVKAAMKQEEARKKALEREEAKSR